MMVEATCRACNVSESYVTIHVIHLVLLLLFFVMFVHSGNSENAVTCFTRVSLFVSLF